MTGTNESNRIELSSLFESTQKKMVGEFTAIREALDHGGTLGNETELAWRDFIGRLLPTRYQACDGFVVDAEGLRSDQIDIIVFDRHYSPPLLQAGSVQYVPAEAVYAVFEVKQTEWPPTSTSSPTFCLTRTTPWVIGP